MPGASGECAVIHRMDSDGLSAPLQLKLEICRQLALLCKRGCHVRVDQSRGYSEVNKFMRGDNDLSEFQVSFTGQVDGQ